MATRTFNNGNSKALRIPQELRTEKKEFFIREIGGINIACPTDDPWASIRHLIGTFPDEYMEDRTQPSWEDVPTCEDL